MEIHNTRGGESHGKDNPFSSAGQSAGITAFMTATKTTLEKKKIVPIFFRFVYIVLDGV